MRVASYATFFFPFFFSAPLMLRFSQLPRRGNSGFEVQYHEPLTLNSDLIQLNDYTIINILHNLDFLFYFYVGNYLYLSMDREGLK